MKRDLIQSDKRRLVWIIITGGVAVLGSYIYGFSSQPGAADILWGGVPQGMRPIYSVNMLLASAGFFIFTYFVLFHINSSEHLVSNRYRFGVFHILYAGILYPSAIWLPLTFAAVMESSIILLWLVRIALVVVGLASLELFVTLLRLKPKQFTLMYWLAIIGCGFFSVQTVILDGIVWNFFFRLS